MRTAKQREASRANGARSRGPVSGVGKARSALNALKHGLFAETVILPGESEDEFETLRDDYLETFAPATVAELAAVNEMAAAAWRLRRVREIERAELELALEDLDAWFEEHRPDATPAQRLALAYRHASGLGAIRSAERQEARLTRVYDRAAARLEGIRAAVAQDAGAAYQTDPGSQTAEPGDAISQNEPEDEATPDSSETYQPDDSAPSGPEADPATPPGRPRTRSAGAGAQGQEWSPDDIRRRIDEFIDRFGITFGPDPDPDPGDDSGNGSEGI